ncbi:hypothetical protein [Lutibacter sp.]
MKKNIFTLVLVLFANLLIAQCLSGDCNNGYGKKKYKEGIYEGTFKNELPDGLGVLNYINDNFYFGQFKNGKLSGFGSFTWKSGQLHTGKWENGIQHGEGIFNDAKKKPTAGIWNKGTFESVKDTEKQTDNPANCIGNCVNGYGRITNPNGTIIQATFENGIAKFGHIKTKLYAYDGYILNNLPNGYGQVGYKNGDHYFGNFKGGKKHGEGIFTPKNKTRIYGKWENDIFINPYKFEFNTKTFCNELMTQLSLTEKERNLQKTKGFSDYFIPILKNKFLTHFEIQQTNYTKKANFTKIIFPEGKEKIPTVSLQSLRDGLKKCKKISVTKNDNEFKFKNKKIILHRGKYGIFSSNIQYELKIEYPFKDLACISGDCQNGFGEKKYSNGSSYKGNFVNGEKEGIGAYIFKDGWKHIGFFKNNISDGEGKQYNENGKLIFEGNFYKYKLNGKGKSYHSNGSKSEGNFKNGKLNGYGKQYSIDGKLNYEGAFLDNKANGPGTLYFANGDMYIGQFKNNKLEGYGKYYNADGELIYAGQFKDGKFIE